MMVMMKMMMKKAAAATRQSDARSNESHQVFNQAFNPQISSMGGSQCFSFTKKIGRWFHTPCCRLRIIAGWHVP